jgi:hypothetical protein
VAGAKLNHRSGEGAKQNPKQPPDMPFLPTWFWGRNPAKNAQNGKTNRETLF